MLDVVVEGEEVILVQEYVHGVPLDKLFKAARVSGEADPRSHRGRRSSAPSSPGCTRRTRRGTRRASRSASSTATSLPQNVIVGVDGIPRLLDFGIAKARSCAHVTRAGLFKGKLAYMAPEQVRAEEVTLAADIYGAGVLLWELLAQRRLHAGSHDLEILTSVASGNIPSLSATLAQMGISRDDERAKLVGAIEPVVLRALSPRPQDRQSSAAEMLDSLVQRCPAATPLEVASWVKDLGADYLERRQQVLSSIEERWHSLSKMAAAFSLDGSPASGVQAVAPAPRAGTSGLTIPKGAVIAPRELAPPIDAWPELRRRLPAWMGTAALLLVSGISLGLGTAIVLGVRRPPEPATSLRGAEPGTIAAVPSVTALAPPPPPPATIEIAEPPPPATQPTPVRATHPFAIFSTPIVHRPPPRPPPPPQRETSSGPTTTTATIPTQGTTPAKVDCDPPFYFEGSKKIFKTGCI